MARLLRAHALPALLFLGSASTGGDAAALAVHHNTSARGFAATASSLPGRLWAEAEHASVSTVEIAAAEKAHAVSFIERCRHTVATWSWIRSPGVAAAHTAFIQVALAVQRRTGSKTAAGAETLVAIGMVCFIVLGMVGLLTLFTQHWQQQAAEQEAKQQQFYAATATMDPSGYGSLGATPAESMRSLNMPQPSPRFPGEGSMNSIPGGAGMDRVGGMGGPMDSRMDSRIDRGSPQNPFQTLGDPPQAPGRLRKNVCC